MDQTSESETTLQWIERKIMPHIMDAIKLRDRSTYVFYITSEGGDGKTVLLRQIGLALGSVDGIAPSQGWSGILDLYHSDVNTNSGLEQNLSQALETVLEEFQSYRNRRAEFAQHREAGLAGNQVYQEGEQAARTFAECVNKVTRFNRVAIALDTTERIQYEVDNVQILCGMENESTAVKAWLLTQIQLWRNCVVLLVGRPEQGQNPYLQSALHQALSGDPRIHYEALTLGSFDKEEAEQYFEQKRAESEELEELHRLEPEFFDSLWEMTEGRPIRLDLAVEVIVNGVGLGELKTQMETGDPDKVREEIEGLLIDQVIRREPDPSIGDVLTYLAVARKGLDASLLHHLAGEWSIETCKERLEAVAKRGFVKQYARDQRLYLHDEMYHLCDTHLLRADQVQSLSRKIVGWYEDQIEAAGDDERERRNLQINALLYRLRADPWQGYRWYAREAESAIRAVQFGYDMRLRGELIAFQKSRSPIDQRLIQNAPGWADEINCDDAARWVKRLMARGQNLEAIQVAEIVSEKRPGPCQSGDPRFVLARADLGVFHAQAMLYAGQTLEAAAQLRRVIYELEQGRQPVDLALEAPDTYDGERRNLVLGRGHNNLGYVYWTLLGYLEAAIQEFQDAIPYFRASDLREEWANTNDNMGRVYALLRHPTRAAALVESALEQRRALDLNYRIALSLNSRAIVHLEFEENVRAERRAREALDMFRELNAPRGIGLASITLGQALRRLGSMWEPGMKSYETYGKQLLDAVELLEDAVRIFQEIAEPVRLVEALNELGAVYRERARLADISDEDSTQPNERAIELLEQCIAIARDLGFTIWYIDSCEDLAEVHFARREFAKAAEWLQKALDPEIVPQNYVLYPGRGRPEIPESERTGEVWLQLGKVELLRGNIAYDAATESGSEPASRDVLRETVRHYLLSAVYFELYSERAKGIQNTFLQMYERLKGGSFEELGYLQQEALPGLAAEYNIRTERFGQFYHDTLGLVLQI